MDWEFGGVNPKRSYCIAAVQSLSHAQPSATPWTTARQALLSMALLRQEYWSGLLFASPGDLLNPGIELGLFLGRWILYH